jgi:NAD-dependent dihydropyrimidine dehydrogenase PreA subunit
MKAGKMNAAPRNKRDCPQPAGKYVPIVDRNRCEGKEDCVTVCPCDVFEMQPLGEADKAAMPFLSRVKARIHGNRQAFAVRAADCQACGLCIAACPENAIKLRRTEAQ